MPAREDVVYWTRSGHVLHSFYDCPPFARAAVREMSGIEAGDYRLVGTVKSYDFNGGGLTTDSEYPPNRLRLCELCRKRRKKAG